MATKTLLPAPRSGRRVALLALYPTYDPASPREHIPNYGIRMIEASLRSADLEGLELEVFDLRDADVDTFVTGVEAMDADVVGCSTYLWSFPTFVEVARRLKASCGERVVVFGGPSAHPHMMGQLPFRHAAACVDALVLGEGETTFVDLVRARDRSRAGLTKIPGVAVWQGERWERSAARPLVADLNVLASPYRLGLISHRGIGGMGVIHHYRGCPYKCSFCEWGPLDDPKRVQSADAIASEIEAMTDAGAESILCIDAGLNINSAAFENLSTAIDRTGVLATRPLRCEVYPTHLTPRQLRFLERTPRPDIGIGLQAWDRNVLANLDRPFDEARFEERVRQLAEIAEVTVEVILGLPGDDLETFKRTFERCLELPAALRVFHAVVLPSALMTRAPQHFALDYDPITLKMNACFSWSRDSLAEASEFVQSTTAEGQGYTGAYLWLFPNRSDRRPEPALREATSEQDPSAAASSDVLTAAPDAVADRDAVAADREASARQPLRDLFRRSGLRVGKIVNGWTVDEVDVEDRGAVARADFSRGSLTIQVRFAAAGVEPRFARVAGIDVTHSHVDGAVSREVGLLVRLIAVWLRKRGIAGQLEQLLSDGVDRGDLDPAAGTRSQDAD